MRERFGFRWRKDIRRGGRSDEDAQQSHLMGDSNPAPTEVRFRDLPDERADLRWCLVRRRAGWLLIFDLLQPAIECGSGDAKMAGDLSPGDLGGLRMPEDEKSFADLMRLSSGRGTISQRLSPPRMLFEKMACGTGRTSHPLLGP